MRITILLVHGDKEFLDSLTDFIKIDNVYDVVSMPDIHQAYQWLANGGRPGVLVTDITEDLKGEMLIKSVRRVHEHIPVLVLTSDPDYSIRTLANLKMRVPLLSFKKRAHVIMSVVDKITGTDTKKLASGG